MVRLFSQVGEWQFATRLPVIRMCALLTMLLFSSISLADEIEELSVTKAGGVYSLKVVSVFDAPADYVYKVTAVPLTERKKA
jgi:hypothetical protein